MRIVDYIYFIVFCMVSFSSFAKKIESINVFYVGDILPSKEVKGVDVKYYDLSSSSAIQKSLSLKLPNNLSDATSFMSEYANSIEGKKTIQGIVNGYQGVGKSFGLGVKELPAIVINDKYVVYGTTDVAIALSFYNKLEGVKW